jgi:hypothetical protein
MKKFGIILWVVFGISTFIRAQEEKSGASNKYRPKYFCEFNLGMLIQDEFRGFTYIKNGVSLHPKIDFSLGLGVESHTTGRYLPIFLEGRYIMLKGKTRPFVSLSAGFLQVIEDWTYSNWNIKNNKHMGFSSGARFGIQKQISPAIFIINSLGYRFTRVQYEQRDNVWGPNPIEPIILPVEPNEPTTMIHLMHRFELSIGLIFR